MQLNYNWKKSLFDRSFEIFSNNTLVGKITKQFFTNSALVQVKSGTYNFKTHGVFRHETAILDIQNKVVGHIVFSSWNKSANMKVGTKTYHWQNRSFWGRKCNITGSEGTLIKYTGSSIKGQIKSNTDNDLIVAAGLFTSNYFWHKTALLVAIIMPIIIMN